MASSKGCVLIGALMMVAGGGAMAQPGALRSAPDPAAPLPAPSTPPTVQQLFQAAAEASAAGNHEAALAALTQLQPRVTKNLRSLSIVRLRKGLALIELARREEAEAEILAGLSGLPRDDPTLKADWYSGEFALAGIEATRLDYRAAMDHYLRADGFATFPVDHFMVLLARVELGTFIDPQAALADADRADALLADIIRTEKEKPLATMAHMATVRGRLLMNLGRFVEAEDALALGVKNLGGLTMTVNYEDLVTRSDASIAAMLAGHGDKARNYLAYTGAGRLGKQDFTSGADMTLPNCGEDGIGPDDVAVVEFGIGDSGAVTYARPIYASRQGDVGLVFARAVAGWSWDPANVKDIPMLFRVVTRLELRCSTGNGALPLFGSTQQAFADWVAGLSVPPFDPPGTNEATRRLALLAELDRRRATFGPSAPALIPVLAQLVNNAVVASAEAAGHAATLQTIMAGLRVPAMARLNVDYRHAMAAAGDKAYRYPPRLDEAPYRDDPVALATLRLTSYDDARGRDRRDGALLEQVLSDPRLPPDHMLRIAALVRRANLRAASGDLVGAQADYASTGLSDQQCSIVDAKPSTKAAPASSSDYPIAMVRLGVEGWTSVQFDIAADGRTLNQRAVISYPPFIFGDSGKKIVSHAIFEQSYRPAGQLGCGGSQRKITFRM